MFGFLEFLAPRTVKSIEAGSICNPFSMIYLSTSVFDLNFFPSGLNKKTLLHKLDSLLHAFAIDPPEPHFYEVKLGITGVNIIFLISAQSRLNRQF